MNTHTHKEEYIANNNTWDVGRARKYRGHAIV